MKKLALTKSLAILLLLGCVHEVSADILYQTGFENPPFTPGTVAGQNGWSVFGVAGAATVQTAVVESGNQAVLVDSTTAGQFQTGPWHSDPFDTSTHANKTVIVDADVMLTSSSKQTSFQFGALTPNLGTFFGGFNSLPDGTLQLITAGFPLTGPVVARDVWNHYEVSYDFADQTFDVRINNALIAQDVPFLTPQTVYGTLLFDSFSNGNDKGYLDNVEIQDVPLVPEPSSFVLLGSGFAMLGGMMWRRGRIVCARVVA